MKGVYTMLKIKVLLFLQDESISENGVHVTDIYDRKISMMCAANPYQTAEECLKDIIAKALKMLNDDVCTTLKSETIDDLEYFYNKNIIGGIWRDEERGGRNE